jgi:outer membrane protein OmpA-like peptidoglycan-associated protein
MKIATVLLALIGAAGISAAQAQTQAGGNQSTPLYRVTMVARTTKAINYGHLSGATQIDFRGTVLMPLARGRARVESKRGAIKIQAQFEKLQPASQFGSEYLTYVLWAITPVGRANNLGEVLLQGSKSKLEVTAELQAFALIVTAEPYFAVIQPSDVVVMENVARPDTAGSIQEIDAKFDLLQRGLYSNVSAELQTTRMDPRVPLGLYEARNAVLVARGAGADHYAADTYSKAEQLLRQAEGYQARNAGSGRKQVEMTAREAVQTAEDARAITVKRQDEERQAMERQAAAEREARAKAQADEAAKKSAQAEVARADAERARLEAELAAERAARERAEAETARAAALTQQQVLRSEADQARQAADLEAQQRVAAEAARAAALAQTQVAHVEAQRARLAADEAERLRQQAEAEKAELRSRLMSQLSSILQTRDSVRGLIVNMSDVLFDSGRYTLKPGAREKLAKISGIVLAYPGLNLQIEGHTDSVGGDEFNQQLSQQRAMSVRDFLVQQGVPAASIAARGFGKTQPVASNDTPEGRQQNRRVELVVTGDAIGTATVASAKTSVQ